MKCDYGPWHPLWPEGRESEWKGCGGEFWHALANVWVEAWRHYLGIEIRPVKWFD